MDGFVEPSFSLMMLHKMRVWLGLLTNQLLQLIKINGLKLHVAETRFKSSPAMIFLHGFPEIQYTWRQQMTIVAKVGYGANSVEEDDNVEGSFIGIENTFEESYIEVDDTGWGVRLEGVEVENYTGIGYGHDARDND
ncbi:epoxide hydrolase [Tanacetum coccineum]